MSGTNHNEPGSSGWVLEFDEPFEGDHLDLGHWLPYHLPQWSNRKASAARYTVGGGELRLHVDPSQPPWCPEFDGQVQVSNLQTGVFSGPVGSTIGQHRFHPDAEVHEAQAKRFLYTPQFARIEARLKAVADPHHMVALWMIGIEDEPEHSAEICIAEIFGRDVSPAGDGRPASAAVGMGVHPFADPSIANDFERVELGGDATDFHVYAADWTPDSVSFSIDGLTVKTVQQSPQYPMQLMLGIYRFPLDHAHDGEEFADRLAHPADPHAHPPEFVVDYIRGYRQAG
jgi:Glycosyl hydrolases family 16